MGGSARPRLSRCTVARGLPAGAGDTGYAGPAPALRRCPGGENLNPLQYSCLENPTDRGAWWTTGHGIAKIQTQLSDRALTHTLSGPSLQNTICYYCSCPQTVTASVAVNLASSPSSNSYVLFLWMTHNVWYVCVFLAVSLNIFFGKCWGVNTPTTFSPGVSLQLYTLTCKSHCFFCQTEF